MRVVSIALPGALVSGAAAFRATSKWASLDRNQRLHYATDARGNRIMDFSHAGYKGGGVTLPAVAVVQTLAPESGDNLTPASLYLQQLRDRFGDAAVRRIME